MLHILLAEDNLGDVLLVQQALEEHQIPHNLRVLHDGAEALNFVVRMGNPGEAPCPDIILLDLNLPKAESIEILSQIRKNLNCPDMRVIALTSSEAPRHPARIAELGIARYFRKPSDLDEFLQLGAIVREVVEGKTA